MQGGYCIYEWSDHVSYNYAILDRLPRSAPSLDGLHDFTRHILGRRVFPKRIDKLSVRVHQVEEDADAVRQHSLVELSRGKTHL